MILSETADQTTLRTNNQSKLIVCLTLIWAPFLLLALAVPVEHFFAFLVAAIIGGLTYSKRFIFDSATKTLIVKTQIYGIKRETQLKFEAIARIGAVSKFRRKETDVVVELKNHRKLVLDKTTDTEHIERAMTAINRIVET